MGAATGPTSSQPSIARTSATTTERISGPSSLNRVPLGSSSRKQLMSRGRSGVSVGCSVCRNARARAGDRKRGSAPVSRAHWQTLSPQMPPNGSVRYWVVGSAAKQADGKQRLSRSNVPVIWLIQPPWALKR